MSSAGIGWDWMVRRLFYSAVEYRGEPGESTQSLYGNHAPVPLFSVGGDANFYQPPPPPPPPPPPALVEFMYLVITRMTGE